MITLQLTHQEQLERAVIGCLWIDFPNDDAMEQINPALFQDPLNRRLLEFMRESRAEHIPVDAVLSGNRLTAEEKRRLFIESADAVTSAALLDHYVSQLRTAHNDRRIAAILAAGELTPENKQVIRDLLDEAEWKRDRLGINPKQIMASLVEHIDACRNKGPEMPTGFTALDSRIGGYHRGELILVAANTGIGKTIFLTTLAHRLIRGGTSILYFTTEMAGTEYIKERLLPAYSGVHAIDPSPINPAIG